MSEESQPDARCAVYFVPHASSLLWSLGCDWLGRDPAGGKSHVPCLADSITRARHGEVTALPRHYGFHATLKPPFALAEGKLLSALIADAAQFARQMKPFLAPPLRVSRIGSFVALTLCGPSPAMDRLAADCVARFDSYRAPAEQEELAARRKAGLSERQEAMLERWGYPYLMEEFTFHMTLTGQLSEPEIAHFKAWLETYFRPVLSAPLLIDRVAVFAQERRERAFMIARDLPFGG